MKMKKNIILVLGFTICFAGSAHGMHKGEPGPYDPAKDPSVKKMFEFICPSSGVKRRRPMPTTPSKYGIMAEQRLKHLAQHEAADHMQARKAMDALRYKLREERHRRKKAGKHNYASPRKVGNYRRYPENILRDSLAATNAFTNMLIRHEKGDDEAAIQEITNCMYDLRELAQEKNIFEKTDIRNFFSHQNRQLVTAKKTKLDDENDKENGKRIS